MTGKDLLGAMCFVDEQFVDEAETQAIKKSGNMGWMRWVSLAACLCVVLAGMFAFGHFGNADRSESITDESNLTEVQQEQVPEEEMADGADAGLESIGVDEMPDEMPSVIVRIVSWQENGFLGTVAELVDTDIFEIGTELTVTFDAETCIAYTEGNQTVYDDRIPTEADFPAGSLVNVHFVSYEKETGTILIGEISGVESPTT